MIKHKFYTEINKIKTYKLNKNNVMNKIILFNLPEYPHDIIYKFYSNFI